VALTCSHTGWFANCILEGSHLDNFVCVDTWHAAVPGMCEGTPPLDHFMHCANRLWHLGSRFALLRLHSAVAAQMFADGFFDFIYIDAEHTYGMVSQDIRLWWPKVRPGGILAGHDYTTAGETSEVCRAVDRFVMQEGLTLYLTECDFVSEENGAKVRSWLVERP
jgi:hypothetical protein